MDILLKLLLNLFLIHFLWNLSHNIEQLKMQEI